MNELNFNHIFKSSFDTFKVFETIPYESFGTITDGHSTSIWQILNHLVIWQEFQIEQLKSTSYNRLFNETKSWITTNSPADKEQCASTIDQFNTQIATIKNIISNLSISDHNLNNKLKIIQESSTHLSFHIGETILIARQRNQYPQPNDMALFLKG